MESDLGIRFAPNISFGCETGATVVADVLALGLGVMIPEKGPETEAALTDEVLAPKLVLAGGLITGFAPNGKAGN